MSPELFAVALAVVAGLTQVVKKAGVSTRYIPVVAIVFGIIYCLAVTEVNVESAIQGIVVGLSTVGLYRTGQKLTE